MKLSINEISLLKEILNEMELPLARLDFRNESNCLWLLRNISFRNENHPRRDVAIFLLKEKMRERKGDNESY